MKTTNPVSSNTLFFCIIILFGAGTLHASESDQGRLFFYPGIHADFRSDLDPDSHQDASDAGAEADFIYKKDINNISVMAEAYATHDDGDIQRLQLGWRLSDDTTVWLGRFYNQIGYWNTEYNRGSYNELSIHRPSIMDYESDGGILTTHLTGVFAEQKNMYQNMAVSFILAVGQGPELTKDAKLEALSLLHSGDTENDTSVTARIAFEVESPFMLKTGLFTNQTTIPSRLGLITEVDQRIFGGYFHSQLSQWSLTWMLISVSNNVKDQNVTQSSSFGGGYAQISYAINHHWTTYVRIEDIESVDHDAYLMLFPDFVIDRNLLGLRLNFRKNQAITFEVLDSDLISGDHFHTAVQWSAMFAY